MRALDNIQMYYYAAVLLVLALGARIASFPVVTSDYTYFVAKWFDALKAPGLSAFAHPFADYSPLYLYVVKLLTHIPVASLYSVKALSVVAELALAACAVLVLRAMGMRDKPRLLLSFAVIWALPTVIMNGALWGQSDVFYAAAVVLSLYYIFTDRPLAATLAFAVAISFKFQAIFFAPILVGYLIRRQDTVPYVFLPPFVFAISVLPAWFGGGQLRYWLLIYAKQSSEYTNLSLSAQSIFAFIEPLRLSMHTQNILFWVGVVVTSAAALAALVLMARAGLSEKHRVLVLALLCAIVFPYLLPRMHERYFYLADIFATLYALYVPRRWYIPVLVVGASTLAYMPYLSHQTSLAFLPSVDLRIPSIIVLATIALVLYEFAQYPEVSRTKDTFSKL